MTEPRRLEDLPAIRKIRAEAEAKAAAEAAMSPEQRAARDELAAEAEAARQRQHEAYWAEQDRLAAGQLAAQRDEQWAEICPSLYRVARVGDIEEGSRSVVEEWCSGPRGRTLLIGGSVGTGKTHAALAAAREVHRQGRSVEFWPMVELWDALRPGGPEGLIQDVCEVDLLVLDDLGAEKPSDWTAERLFLIANRRALDELPTIATTNLVGKDLRAAVGDRVYDRLVNERTVTVVFEGGSRRGRARRG